MARSPSAEYWRRATREKVSALTPAQRIHLALKLGRRYLELFASTNGLSLAEARRLLDNRKDNGRRRARGR